ncbi:hypothetical protein K438DRAFT_1927010 [Mycena galopus ATCC 62051]|nr:hypothetical protein K438DRAFT_1927010 [Mycena galopus ATCC 62051]
MARGGPRKERRPLSRWKRFRINKYRHGVGIDNWRTVTPRRASYTIKDRFPFMCPEERLKKSPLTRTHGTVRWRCLFVGTPTTQVESLRLLLRRNAVLEGQHIKLPMVHRPDGSGVACLALGFLPSFWGFFVRALLAEPRFTTSQASFMTFGVVVGFLVWAMLVDERGNSKVTITYIN